VHSSIAPVFSLVVKEFDGFFYTKTSMSNWQMQHEFVKVFGCQNLFFST
jgi:hypothetical protein